MEGKHKRYSPLIWRSDECR